MLKIKTYTLRQVSEITGIPYSQVVQGKEKMGLILVETVWNGKKKKRKDNNGNVVPDEGNRVSRRYVLPAVGEFLIPTINAIPGGIDALQPDTIEQAETSET